MASPSNPLAFILAGNATFTVVSARTDVRFTFRVRRSGEYWHRVQVLTGPSNEDDYQFLGTVFKGSYYMHSYKSRISPEAPSAKAARWVCQRILDGLELPNCELHHEGRCGRCGRKLTVPESIISGIGPECAQKLCIT